MLFYESTLSISLLAWARRLYNGLFYVSWKMRHVAENFCRF